jgi:acetyl esterase/lipase
MTGCGDSPHSQDTKTPGVLTAPESYAGIPRPPEQPASGPGGSDYAHDDFRMSNYGRGKEEYWIFEPISPTPSEAPLVVFNHGWLAQKPWYYKAWIEHITKKGNIVIYPRYQISFLTPNGQFTDNAIRAVKDAITRLQDGEHVYPILDKFAVVGHSAGGMISMNMVARAPEEGLPKPLAVMVVEPYTVPRNEDDFGSIDSDILMLVIVGEDDDIAGEGSAKHIFRSTPQIPLSNKDYITILTDRHGTPNLKADHIAPLSPSEDTILMEADALDYYAFWKLFDALTDYAFYGENGEYALDNTPEQRYMGIWSDGIPVKELIVTDHP